MSRNTKRGKSGSVRMELKYCEHCGGLYVREGGAGVYCERCQPKVAELPVPKKKPGKIHLPQGPRTRVEEYEMPEEYEAIEDDLLFEAAGGVA